MTDTTHHIPLADLRPSRQPPAQLRRAADLLEAAKASRDPLAVASMLGEVRSICLEVAGAIDEFANPSLETLGAMLGREARR